MNLGLFGLVGGGMDYSIEGKPISRMEDFESLIYPIHDVEATDLLREAKDDHLIGLDVLWFGRPCRGRFRLGF